jgi:hypothetical protein
MQGLPAEVASRQAGRVVAAPPAPNTWLLAVGGPPSAEEGGSISSSSSSSSSGGGGGGGGGSAASFLDVTTRGSALLSDSEARARYPGLDAGPGGPPLGARVVGVWAELARTLVMAHQRRGESDLVAHWMYQALALDTRAPEWAHLLGG